MSSAKQTANDSYKVPGVGHQRANPDDLVWLLQPGPSLTGGLTAVDRDERLRDLLLGCTGL